MVVYNQLLAHHTKNCIIKTNHIWSGRTVSKHFHHVLNSVIRLHSILLSQPRPIDENYINERWKHFKGHLGALDGTYINVIVPVEDRARYCNRKESAAHSRVLPNAITMNNGFCIPQGLDIIINYIAPTRFDLIIIICLTMATPTSMSGGLRSGTSTPHNKEKYFNMKHSKASKCIEKLFGILKKRWGIFRSASFYPIKVKIALSYHVVISTISLDK
ncbi:hypothetical protein ACS0TY_023760 [Phlomoides rotata]